MFYNNIDKSGSGAGDANEKMSWMTGYRMTMAPSCPANSHVTTKSTEELCTCIARFLIKIKMLENLVNEKLYKDNGMPIFNGKYRNP